jgi:DnaJ-class molecular chaperone
MACDCTRCEACKGSGTVWYSGNDYLGTGRCDDFDEPEYCDMCDGTGISSWCRECCDEEREAVNAEMEP